MQTHIIEMEREIKGGTLRLWKYHLVESDREQRLPTSHEYDIEFINPGGHSSITPRAWYIPREELVKFYWGIKNENEFRKVYELFKKRGRQEQHQPIEELLRQLSAD